MNPIRNPYQPGAGCRPPELVGRDEVLNDARILLARIAAGRNEKSMLLTGLRGVGKTVLLNEMVSMAEEMGYLTSTIEVHEDKKLAAVFSKAVRHLLIKLSALATIAEETKQAVAVLASFVNSFKIIIEDKSYGFSITPASGVADSGDLELDLPELFEALGLAAKKSNKQIVFAVDEIQYMDAKELSSLIMAMHKAQQKNLPIVLLGAGLPILPTLAGESKSYAERLFSFPIIDALNETESGKALREPARVEHVTYTDEAIAEIYRLTKGYPYYLQEWGFQSWNRAYASPITLDVVQEATTEAIDRLDNNFFRVRYDRCTKSEKDYLLAIANLGDGPQSTGDIAKAKRVRIQSFGPVRAKLIRKGMIYSPYHSAVDFTVPLFGEFMKRTKAKEEQVENAR